jgi:lysophospholipase L1-like esterase
LIRQLNLFLEGAALESGAKFVKCAGAVTGRNGFLEDRYSADGTHLNDEGYEKIAALLSASLPEDFFPKQP